MGVLHAWRAAAFLAAVVPLMLGGSGGHAPTVAPHGGRQCGMHVHESAGGARGRTTAELGTGYAGTWGALPVMMAAANHDPEWTYVFHCTALSVNNDTALDTRCRDRFAGGTCGSGTLVREPRLSGSGGVVYVGGNLGVDKDCEHYLTDAACGRTGAKEMSCVGAWCGGVGGGWQPVVRSCARVCPGATRVGANVPAWLSRCRLYSARVPGVVVERVAALQQELRHGRGAAQPDLRLHCGRRARAAGHARRQAMHGHQRGAKLPDTRVRR